MRVEGGFQAGWRGGKAGLLIVAVGAMFVAVYLGLSIGHGEWKKTYLLILGMSAFPLMLALGSSYWAVLPFALTVSLPAIPLVPGRAVSVGELAAMAAVAALALRLPFTETKLRWVRVECIPMLLYVLWAGFIFKANGAGLAIFGASTVGARSYLVIALAFGAFFVIFNQRIEDRHCKFIVFSLLASAALSTGWNIYRYFFLQTGEDMYSGGFYSWHQNLSVVPMFFLAFAFAKYSLSDLLRETRVGWLVAILLCYALAAYSGKRAVFAACLLMPLLSFAFRRHYLDLALSLLAVAGLLTALVAGHGRVFELPLTVQRVLWVLPGAWDPEVKMSTLGSFRKTLNKLAKRQIAAHPVVGRGFGFTPTEAKMASNPQTLKRIVERGDHVGAYVMAVGGQWHSTWLGIAATLGIPGAVLWGLIWLQMILVGLYVARRAPPDSYTYLLAVMVLMLTAIEVCRSMTSGHAAGNLWGASWQLAVLLVLRRQIMDGETARSTSARQGAQPGVAQPGTIPPREIPTRFAGGPREALARRLR